MKFNIILFRHNT